MSDLELTVAKLLIVLIIGAISGLLIPFIKSKLDDRKKALLEDLVEKGVKAAEYYFKEPKSGIKKRAYVLAFLVKKGIKISSNDLDILIDSILYEMNKAIQK